MSTRSLAVFIIFTCISIILAAYSLTKEPELSIVRSGEPVFPGLLSGLDNVVKISLKGNKRTMTMVFREGKWTLEESDGYFLDSSRVRRAILGLAGLRYVEAKTAKKESHVKLDLRSPNEKDGRGRAIQVFDNKRNLLADIILGKSRYNMPGTTKGGVYFRKPNDAQTWLGVGNLDVSRLPEDWLQTKILDVPSSKIKEVVLRHHDGEQLIIKQDFGVKKFVLLNIPMKKKLRYESDPENIATVLEGLELEDARSAGKIGFQDKDVEVTFLTTDNLRFKVILMSNKIIEKDEGEDEKGYWITIAAESIDKTMIGAAKNINDRTSPWIFKIPAYKGIRLNKRLNDMLEDEKPKI